MKISCFGAGYVGGPTMAVLAQHHEDDVFIVYDVNEELILKWNSPTLPIFEDGLTIPSNLHFTNDIDLTLKDCDIAFIAVNTPTKNGQLDLSYVISVIQTIKAYTLTKPLIIVEKSTVPVETCDYIKSQLPHLTVISNPEFMAEGTAIRDLLYPDRIILGGDIDSCKQIAKLYNWVSEDRFIFANIYSAELSKIVSNAFLAQRISSINCISQVCEAVGANIDEVSNCVGADRRIGSQYLKTSIGFGGACLLKDLQSLIYLCEYHGLSEAADYWRSVIIINDLQKNRFINKIKNINIQDKVIAVLGCAFKANTNDVRQSPATDIIDALLLEGATIRIYDPQAKYKDLNVPLDEVFKNAHAIVLLTEWPEFKMINYTEVIQMVHSRHFFDGRNLLDPEQMREIGFQYHSIGREYIKQ